MIPNSDEPDLEPYAAAAVLDPLNFDPFAPQLPVLISERNIDAIFGQLVGAAARGVAVPDERIVALAALRDLDFLINAAHHLSPDSYKSVGGLEALLVRLGTAAGHVPRGSVYTYGVCNPLDGRMRTFTGTPEERLFIKGLREAMVGLDDVLAALAQLARHRIDSPAAQSAAAALSPGWEPMVTAAVEMRRHMPPELFSNGIIPFFGPLEISGAVYDGITGAHMQTVAIDYVLHGIEATDPQYLAYAEHNLAALLPHQRRLVQAATTELRGRSLVAQIAQDIEAGGDELDAAAAAGTVTALQRFLARISAFRTVHTRLASVNLPLRSTEAGSGGHDLELLVSLLNETQAARRRVGGASEILSTSCVPS